jgi:hypothetical protein
MKVNVWQHIEDGELYFCEPDKDAERDYAQSIDRDNTRLYKFLGTLDWLIEKPKVVVEHADPNYVLTGGSVGHNIKAEFEVPEKAYDIEVHYKTKE